jgi:rhodanese-related sulfurtransferase
MCSQGLRSRRVIEYLKRNGYFVKVLLGGIESLDGLIDYDFNPDKQTFF